MEGLPSAQERDQAKQALESYRLTMVSLQEKSAQAQTKLKEAIAEAERQLRSLDNEATDLQVKVAQAEAFLAPIRKMPQELLAEVFRIIFWSGDKKCAWKLARVNRLWRRLALGIPTLWSSINLTTTTSLCPADTIRLWLERSGNRTPLDIDITLVNVSAFQSADNPDLILSTILSESPRWVHKCFRPSSCGRQPSETFGSSPAPVPTLIVQFCWR